MESAEKATFSTLLPAKLDKENKSTEKLSCSSHYSTAMGSHSSKAFGASPQKLHTVGIKTWVYLEPCAAEEQGKADIVRSSATSQILSALPTLQQSQYWSLLAFSWWLSLLSWSGCSLM